MDCRGVSVETKIKVFIILDSYYEFLLSVFNPTLLKHFCHKPFLMKNSTMQVIADYMLHGFKRPLSWFGLC